jgi:hypothetical protein
MGELDELLTSLVDPDQNEFGGRVLAVSENLHEIREAGFGGIVEAVKVVDDDGSQVAKAWKFNYVL